MKIFYKIFSTLILLLFTFITVVPVNAMIGNSVPNSFERTLIKKITIKKINLKKIVT
jgi:hypothetical protein